MSPKILLKALLLVQGAFYILTGLWPLFSINTFQMVTGPKHDLWLVRTVGVLVTVIGTVLSLGARRRRVPAEMPLLAVGSAVGLAGIDIIYVGKKRILPIYLVDAVAELALATGVLLVWRSYRREHHPVRPSLHH